MKLTKNDILNAKILIVDDQSSNVVLLESLLQDAGYLNVTTTTDPTVVCAWHQQKNYDLILLDLKMPGMDGFQVMDCLKKIDGDSYIPVVVLTAQLNHKMRALQAGAKDFIGKPFDLLEVKTRIKNMLEVRLLYTRLDNYNKILEETVQLRTEELRRSEMSFRSLTELASDWYWEQDETGKFTKASGPVLEVLGLKIDSSLDNSVIGETAIAADLVGWNELERIELQDIIARRKPFIDFSFSRTKFDGSIQYYRVSGEPMFDERSRFVGYRGIGIQYSELSSKHCAHNS